MSVPDVLLRIQGKSSFVDFAFSSATPEKEVALVSAISSRAIDYGLACMRISPKPPHACFLLPCACSPNAQGAGWSH